MFSRLIVARIVRISNLEPECSFEFLAFEDISGRERPSGGV